MDKYPEHEKLKALGGENQIIGNFLDWLCEQNIVLAVWVEGDRLVPDYRSTRLLMADYFDIDMKKLEAEKRQMLDAFDAAQSGAQ